MPQFAANLTMLFNDTPFQDRIDRAAAAGFKAIEFLFPYQEDVDAIRQALTNNGVQQILFNLPARDFAVRAHCKAGAHHLAALVELPVRLSAPDSD